VPVPLQEALQRLHRHVGPRGLDLPTNTLILRGLWLLGHHLPHGGHRTSEGSPVLEVGARALEAGQSRGATIPCKVSGAPIYQKGSGGS
jgi:hypothetical protein